ncbi:hypothetical protein BDV95DRAFT_603964 [Massariosphaeria phaeospora]|uniref:Peptidase metallopeptidase domain-containing protein n=1 Tax=Massariosphaeria phaeospora TaxID=100035 RepID=A0A7C8MEV3_9PLEO|nr:hypothetical protein BDV95DRAFT_603964 [Massariosphaeria phaeospora]
MRLLAVLTAVLATVTLACPPPLNNMLYASNKTHSSADLIRLAVTKRWSDAVTKEGNAHQPWPREGSGKVTYIDYCFSDKNSDDDLRDIVKVAWKMWRDRIGKAGSRTGHSLSLREQEPPCPEEPYCYLQESEEFNGDWNPEFSPQTLVIESNPGSFAAAVTTTGYIPGDAQGRHRLVVNKRWIGAPDSPVRIMAHEIGHVFGLWHEHQRRDRNMWLHFDCSKLFGYDDAKKRVEADTANDYTMDQVCDDPQLCIHYGLGCDQWATRLFVDGGGKYDLTNGQPLDVESIMMYASTAGMYSTQDMTDIDNMPLVKWKNPGDNVPSRRTHDNVEIIPLPEKVSELDYAGIRHIYPWISS